MKNTKEIRIIFRVTDSEYAQLQKSIARIRKRTGKNLSTSQAMRQALNSFTEENA